MIDMLTGMLLAAVTPVLAPSGPWNVEYSENLCLLSRPFGEGRDRVLVGLQPIFSNPRMDVIVIASSASRFAGITTGGTGSVAVEGGARFDGRYTSFPLSDKQQLTRMTVSRDLLDQIRPDANLAIKAHPFTVVVQPHAYAKAMTAFQACQADLLKSWKVDPASLAPERAPKADAWKFFSTRDYPLEAVRARYSGRVVVVLQVGTDGRVTDCKPVVSAGSVLDTATCERATAIRFTPGRDAAGNPAPSISVQAVRWELPG